MPTALELLNLPALPHQIVAAPPLPVPPPPDEIDLADVQELAKFYTNVAIDTLVDVARNSTRDAARVAAALGILERGHGKIPQGVIEVGEGASKVRVEWV